MSAELVKDDLLIVRTFDAPLGLVWSLWSDPDHMRRWMGPGSMTCMSLEMDFRVGGAYRGLLRSTQYGDDWFGGVYREIEPHRRLVFTYGWEQGPSKGVEMLVALSFEEKDGATVQTFYQSGCLTAERAASHTMGWSSAFEKQPALLHTLKKEHTL
jgi:uncharacterized protein YndB with AHSA1/START domain